MATSFSTSESDWQGIDDEIKETLKTLESIKNDCEEIRKMLSSTTKTMNSKLHSAHSKLTKGGTTEGEV